MKKVFILAAIALVAAVVAIGAYFYYYESFLIIGDQYLLPQSQANGISDVYSELLELMIDENAEKTVECYKVTGDIRCAQSEWEKTQEKERKEACRTTVEECEETEAILDFLGTIMITEIVPVKGEWDQKMPIALRLKQTRSMYDAIELICSLVKINYVLIAAADGVGHTIYYYDINISKDTPVKVDDKELTSKSELINHFTEIRKEFEEKKAVELSDEQFVKRFIDSNEVAIVTASIKANPATQARLSADAILTLPSPQKQKIIETLRTGFDGLLEICNEKANEFDTVISNMAKTEPISKENDWRIFYFGRYLSTCNRFLGQFE